MLDKNILSINENGYAWIENGKVFVTNNEGKGIPAHLIPNNKIELIINDKKVICITAIKNTDKIEIKTKKFTQPMKIKIDVPENNMEAFLEYQPENTIETTVKNSLPYNRLKIDVNTLYKKSKPKLTKSILLKELIKNNIKYGLLYSEFENIINLNSVGKYIIAKGTDSIPAVNDSLKLYFKPDNPDSLPEEVSINFNAKNNIVKKNEHIAIFKKGIPGKPGIDIKGNYILPKSYKQIKIHHDERISFNTATGIMKSLVDGIINISVVGSLLKFNVVEELYINKETTNNIEFNGNIIIKRSFEKSNIKSKGSVEIHGNVISSIISAIGNINIYKGIISSSIQSGFYDSICKNPIPIIIELMKELNLSENINTKKIQSNIWKLNSLKYINSNDMKKCLSNNYSKNLNFFKTQIKKISEEIIKNHNNIHKPVFTGNIQGKFSTDSTILSNKNILISGKGVFNSNLISKENITIINTSAGSRLNANKSIYIKKAISYNNKNTIVSVPENGSIFIDEAHPGTIIKIGSNQNKITELTKNITASVINGQIEFDKFENILQSKFLYN